MNLSEIKAALSDTPVPEVKYFDSIGSTNDIAMDWALQGAEDYSLVFADQQTSGRGRLGRKWVTESGAALAFSLVIHPTQEETEAITLFSPLGALAISDSLEILYNLDTQIKWPNDVLYRKSKFSGILVETSWMDNRVEGIIIGIGANIKPSSVPPADTMLYPATCIEDAIGMTVNRLRLLNIIIKRIIHWREHFQTASFLAAWEEKLAFKGEWVQILQPKQETLTGKLLGVELNGNLVLETETGERLSISVGDLHLRPI